MSITLNGLADTATPDDTSFHGDPFTGLSFTNLVGGTTYTLTITLSSQFTDYVLLEGDQGGANAAADVLSITDTGANLTSDVESVLFQKDDTWSDLTNLSEAPVTLTFALTSPSSVSLGSEQVFCFAAGTRILTPRGDVAVERLREGDRVVTARQGGGLAPVRWIGKRTLSPALHPRPWDVAPIRIRAGALGASRPSRDLLLSPDHSLFLDGVLIRARDLLNGATVVQDDVAEITYYHVELDRHDVLLAEGVPAESFLDTGNRGAFENGGAAMQTDADFARAVWAKDACATLVWEGPTLEAVREKLAARAEQLGWQLTDDPDLCVIARGRTILPTVGDGALVFDLPPDTQRISLQSRTTVPAFVLPGVIDTRVLGVGVTAIALDGSELALASDALTAGWLAPEQGVRWTQGEATLQTAGARQLHLSVAGLLRYWVAPETGFLAMPERRAA
jgi:Hint domain